MNVSGNVRAVGNFTKPRVPTDPVPRTVTLHVNEDKRELVFVFSLDGFQAPRLEVERRSRGARQREGDGLFAAEAGEPDRIVSDRSYLLAFVVLFHEQNRQVKVRRLNARFELDA